MKVLLQWARRNPTDWLEIEPTAWASLPTRAAPGRGELGGQNNQLGWICNLMVQGIRFNGFDHYHVEPVTIGLDEGVRVTTWNDDPDDWPVGERHARIWTILPLAPDPALGNAINTRQSQIVYAEGERFARLDAGLPQNTSLRPWSEFVPPANPRHGAWMDDAKYAQHITTQAERGWRHWVDHLPLEETELDERGLRVLKTQRELGRYRIPSRTITYYQRDTDLAAGWIAATNEDSLATTTAASATESITLNATSVVGWAFNSPSGSPGSTNWDGVYHVQLDCTVASAGVVYHPSDSNVLGFPSIRPRRVSSDLASLLETAVETITVFSGTGLKLATSGSETWTSPASTDRFGFAVLANGDSHGDTITLRFNTADSYADGPWETGPATTQPYYHRTGGVPGMRIGRPGTVFGRSWIHRLRGSW